MDYRGSRGGPKEVSLCGPTASECIFHTLTCHSAYTLPVIQRRVKNNLPQGRFSADAGISTRTMHRVLGSASTSTSAKRPPLRQRMNWPANGTS